MKGVYNMPIRMTGMISGLDTDTLIQSMIEAQRIKNRRVEDKSTLLTWKQDKWKELNTKLVKLYKEDLNKMRLQSSYLTKAVTTSNNDYADIKAMTNAPLGTHKLQVESLASSQYVTGGVINTRDAGGNTVKATANTKLTELINLSDLDASKVEAGTLINITVKGEKKTFEVKANSTINDFVNFAKSAGLSANYDAKHGRLYLSAKNSGEENAFGITATTSTATDPTSITKINNAKSSAVGKAEEYQTNSKVADTAEYSKLKFLGLDAMNETGQLINETGQIINEAGQLIDKDGNIIKDEDGEPISGTTEAIVSKVVQAANSEIIYNGVNYTGSTNQFNVNGLEISLKKISGDEIVNLNVTNNSQGVYDMVKDFVTSYNEILKEMNDLYYAPSARGYDPLTDDEKELMTEKEIEKWEDKIKDSILRNDSTLGSLLSSMKTALMTSVEVDGKKYSLSSFGIQTSANYKENGLLHIFGDEDDAEYGSRADKLLKALGEDPDTVMEVLSKVSQNLYDTMYDKMKPIINVRSMFTFYNDKTMSKQQTDYAKKIAQLEAKLLETEDKYYKQFAAMETAMARLQSQSNALAGMLGVSNQK